MSPEILLIDDDAVASALRKRVLERQGYRVQIALDGHSGIALTVALNPDLILMDHQLPDLIGSVLIQRLRDIRPNTPIIVYSGYDGLREQYTTLPNDFITKGESVESMLDTIAKHVA